MTTQVKALEREFGVELFARRGRRVELTETGSGLLDITRRLSADEKEAADYLNETRELQHRPSARRRRRPLSRHRHAGRVQCAPSRALSLGAPSAIRARRSPICSITGPTWRCWPMSIPIRGWSRFPTAATGSSRSVTPIMPSRGGQSIRLRDMEGQRLIVREAGSTTRRAFEQALDAQAVYGRAS